MRSPLICKQRWWFARLQCLFCLSSKLLQQYWEVHLDSQRCFLPRGRRQECSCCSPTSPPPADSGWQPCQRSLPLTSLTTLTDTEVLHLHLLNAHTHRIYWMFTCVFMCVLWWVTNLFCWKEAWQPPGLEWWDNVFQTERGGWWCCWWSDAASSGGREPATCSDWMTGSLLRYLHQTRHDTLTAHSLLDTGDLPSL